MSPKNRTKVRFRIEAVEEFERRIERQAVRPIQMEPPGRPSWYKGEIMLDIDGRESKKVRG